MYVVCGARNASLPVQVEKIIKEVLRCHTEQREHDSSTFATVNVPWSDATGDKCTVTEIMAAIWARERRPISPRGDEVR